MRRVVVVGGGRKGLVWQSFHPDPAGGRRRNGKLRGLSAVGGQLGLNVHSADGAFPAGGQPLVHARLVEEVHAR